MNGEARAVRAVAFFEAAKGLVVITAASGLFALIHKDLPGMAAALIAHAHLNPASKYPRIFIDALEKLQDMRLWMLAAGAAAYAALRFVEAWGLYRERAWAEVLAAASGAIYVPFELLALFREPTWHGAALLVLNLAVVGIMLQALARRRKKAAGA